MIIKYFLFTRLNFQISDWLTESIPSLIKLLLEKDVELKDISPLKLKRYIDFKFII
jgi:hypothetical protein